MMQVAICFGPQRGPAPCTRRSAMDRSKLDIGGADARAGGTSISASSRGAGALGMGASSSSSDTSAMAHLHAVNLWRCIFLPFLHILLPNSTSHEDSKPCVHKTRSHSESDEAQEATRKRRSHSDFLTVHINQLELNFRRTLRFNWRTGCRQKRPSLGRTKFHLGRPRMTCSPEYTPNSCS